MRRHFGSKINVIYLFFRYSQDLEDYAEAISRNTSIIAGSLQQEEVAKSLAALSLQGPSTSSSGLVEDIPRFVLH